MQILFRFQIFAVVLFGGLAGCASRVGGEFPPIMSWAEYAAVIDSDRPVLYLRGERGALLYIGAEHSNSAAHAQVDFIKEAWERFRPTVALNEGGNWPLAANETEAVRHSGEAGLVRYLAAQSKISLETLEPPLRDEVAEHLKMFTPQQVKLFYVLRMIAQKREQEGREPTEEAAKRILDYYSREAGLTSTPNTVADLDLATREELQGRDWHTVDGELFWPLVVENDRPRAPNQTDPFTHRLASSTFRDAFIAQKLAALVDEGENAIAVIGRSHLAVQETYLRCRISRICPTGKID